MATTSNFGWTTPDDTDLVKDGALAIRTLGNNIDTSLVDLKGGTTGQILSKNSNTDLDYTWINNDQGDITAVTAGTGISGGGTTGAVTITNDMATTITASGDIIVGTGSGTYDNLPIGTTGQVLTADTTVSPYKVKWAAGGGDLVRITTNTFTAQSSLVFTDCFTSTYDNYLLLANVICSTGTPNVTVFLRAAGSNYTTADQAFGYLYTTWGNTVTAAGFLTNANMSIFTTNTERLNFKHEIFNPFLSARTQAMGQWVDSTDTGWLSYYAGNTNSYTSLNVTVSSGTFSGEISIYGYKRS